MKIALLTALDPRDKRSWSGTMYYMSQALQKYCGEVSYIGPIDAPVELCFGRLLHGAAWLFLKKKFLYRHCFAVSKHYAKVAQRKLLEQAFDVIVAPSGATEVAFLETELPIVLVEDAHFAILHEYHQHLSNLMRRSAYEARVLQEKGITNAHVLLYPTAWAAQSAIEHYHIDQRNVHVVPFGANLEYTPVESMLAQRQRTGCCTLLFVGVNWQRKGGDIAFETLLHLERMGIAAELIICGCVPPKTMRHKHMQVIPFLDKNDERQRQALEALYMRANFFLLPTRNECYGIAFCEANAFGLPVITTDTGGVAGVINNSENGFMLPLEARGDAYARIIAHIYEDEQWYNALVRSSRMAFEQRLNWDAWGRAVKEILADLC